MDPKNQQASDATNNSLSGQSALVHHHVTAIIFGQQFCSLIVQMASEKKVGNIDDVVLRQRILCDFELKYPQVRIC